MSFPRYQKYKDSGIDGLKEVPAHWSILPLKALTSHNDDVLDDTTPPQMEILYVDISGVDGISGINSKEVWQYSEAPSRARRRVKDGDVIISTVRTYLKAIAKISNPEENLVVSTGFAVVRPRTGITPGFLGNLVSANYFIEQVIARSTGVSYPAINASELVSIHVAIPPLEEQQRIVEFLDRETAKIDTLVAKQQQLMDLLREKVVSLALTSAAGAEEMRLENAVSVIARAVEQHEGELYKPIGLYNRGRGLFHKEARTMADMGDSDFFWVEEGDLILSGQFAWEGAIALAGADDSGCVASHRYPIVRGKENIARTEYILALLSTKHGDFLLNEHSRGAAGRNRPLNIKTLLKEKVRLPDFDTQEKVALAVHWKSHLFDKITKQIALLHERRTAMISAFVTGQYDVHALNSERAA